MTPANLQTPLGPVSLRAAAGRIVALDWQAREGEATALEAEGLRQLAEYFAGQRQRFDLPLAPAEGAFGAFLRQLAAIPFGETRTYGEIARALGLPAQQVGQMCGQNRIPILYPCHRVLGATTLGGFSAPGGIEAKVALLRHEGAAGLLI